MSRHRIVRNYIGVDSEYYEDEVFGRSVEEDTPLSPSLSQVPVVFLMKKIIFLIEISTNQKLKSTVSKRLID